MKWRKERHHLDWVSIMMSNKSLRQNHPMNQNTVWCKWKSVYLKSIWTTITYFRNLVVVRRVKSSLLVMWKENKNNGHRKEWIILLWHLGWIKGIQGLLIFILGIKQTPVVTVLSNPWLVRKTTVSMNWWSIQPKSSRSRNMVTIKRSRDLYR